MFRKKFWILDLSLLLVFFLFVSCGSLTKPPLPSEWEHKMHYPQLPEAENGFSVFATIDAPAPYYVADDWKCSESGLITSIHFWGHWYGSTGEITGFEIAIAEKINTCDVGEILWQQNFPIDEVSVSGYTEATPNGWYEPLGAYYDNVGEGYWQYDIDDIEGTFCQQEGEEYWLIIGAYVNSSLEGFWGWRNTESVHFGCTAMYSHGITSGEEYWEPLDNPPDYNQPLDMAFVITGGEPCEPEVCACLYSGMDGMEMLVDENWDINDPDAGSWESVNIIPQGDANASAWGDRFPDLPWSFMYNSCADWVYGNNNWNSPVSHDNEYYRLPFTVPINGNCVWVGFQAYIDDGAKFYIDGSGFNGPTLFYEHDSDDSMDNHDPVEFWVDPNAPAPICLGPGEYTIYIDHLDTVGVIYGLIFTAECVPCECPCQCGDWNDTNNDGTSDVTVEGNVVNVMGTTNITTADFPVTIVPGYQCQGSNCTVTYGWQVVGPNVSSGGPVPAPIELTQQELDGLGEYVVNLEAHCDGQECFDDFKFKIVVEEPCVEHSIIRTVGICDDFNLPTEATSPSQALLNWIAADYGNSETRDCDEVVLNRYWAHTFPGLEPSDGCHIVSATLEITVRNYDILNANDALLIGFIGDAGDSWDFATPLSDWVAVGNIVTITLDLSDVYDDGNTNLLDIIESEGFLDVAVQDDSPVDCAILHVTYGP